MSDRIAPDDRWVNKQGPPPRSGWYGWIAFAASIMVVLGSFHAISGLVALFKDDYFLTTQSGLVLDVNYTTWGWTHLIFGVFVLCAGIALFAGKTWARVVACVLAILSAIVNLMFMPAYPLWSIIMIALDILVIYAVTTYADTDR